MRYLIISILTFFLKRFRFAGLLIPVIVWIGEKLFLAYRKKHRTPPPIR